MKYAVRTAIPLILFLLLITPCYAAQAGKKSSDSQETLQRYIEDLKKNPADNALREKIIKLLLA